MPTFTVEVSWFEIFGAVMWGLFFFMGFHMGRRYESAGPSVAAVVETASSAVPSNEGDSVPSEVPEGKASVGDAVSDEPDLGYEPGDYSPGASSDESPFAYAERKEYLWHLNEEVKAWDRYQAELREQASMAAEDPKGVTHI